ncbi:hypothetical protein I3760_03G126400 [Carya illinoinensis]|nr:hypothetical protein I3760_03G126400 [Carya illinoinensis]
MIGASKTSASSQVTTKNVKSETTIVNSGTNFSTSHSSFHFAVHKLNGKSYLEWAHSVKLAINVRGKLSHLNVVSKLAADDPNLKTWRSENSLVIAWLINSMELAIGKPHLFLPTAKDVWEVVHDMYSNLENSSQIFNSKSKLW